MNGISVIICCYNSSKRIEETLEFLVAQKCSNPFPWEIIIVDNASTDSTSKTANTFFTRHPGVPFRLVTEGHPGLMNARMRGVRESAYEILLFCDDDNHLEQDYLENAYKLFRKFDNVAIAGGWNRPKFSHYPGKWIEANYSALAIEPSPRPEGFVEWVFGAGMVVRKNVFDKLTQAEIQPMLMGRQGSKQTSGDDAELCHLVRFLGYKIYYTPDLILYHKISQNRLTRSSFIKANFRNIFPVAYFYVLGFLMSTPDIPMARVRYLIFRKVITNMFYFLPRVFFGKNNFYSFIMYYQNVQLFLWGIFRWSTLNSLYTRVKKNLYKTEM